MHKTIVASALLFAIASTHCDAAEARNELAAKKRVTRPKIMFRPYRDHELPKDMVVKGTHIKYRMDISQSGLDPKTAEYRFEIVSTKGNTRFLDSENVGRFSEENDNILEVDQFGETVVKMTARDALGKEVTTEDKVFCHFSYVKIAGGDVRQLHERANLDDYDTIKGKIKDGKLVKKGLRFLPDIEGDTREEGGKHGFYLTKEPRAFRSSKGTLYCAYHVNVGGRRTDAPQGMGLVVSISDDGGNTWKDTLFLHDRDAAIGYTSFVEYEGVVQLYFTGGHISQPEATKYQGVYRVVTEDGRNWSDPEPMDEMTKLLTGGKERTVGRDIYLNHNGLVIPDMEWKGESGTAIVIPFYLGVHLLISMDDGESWDIFYKDRTDAMDEVTITLLDNRKIYLVSRTHDKFKKEYLLDLDGSIERLKQTNHIGLRCHHGTDKMSDGRILFASHMSRGREDATISIGDAEAEEFETRALFEGGGWGYCDVTWLDDEEAIYMLGECEPIHPDTREFMDFANHYFPGVDNERFSITGFKFSLDYFETLKKVNVEKRVRKIR